MSAALTLYRILSVMHVKVSRGLTRCLTIVTAMARGVKRSILNAMFYYVLAGKDVFSAETLAGDPFAVFVRMIDSDTCRCRPGTDKKKLSARTG